MKQDDSYSKCGHSLVVVVGQASKGVKNISDLTKE
jgi:hypothetical protein